MPEVQEVFRMATQKVNPTPGRSNGNIETSGRASRGRRPACTRWWPRSRSPRWSSGSARCRATTADPEANLPQRPSQRCRPAHWSPGRMSSARTIPTSTRRIGSPSAFRMVMRGLTDLRFRGSGEQARWP
jgi:hypothetical protein